MNFDIVDASIIDDGSDTQFATARIEAFSTGASLHDTTCDDETLRRTASTIYEKPIIFEYDPMFGDFGSHPDERKPVISGFVVRDSADFIVRPDGRTTLTVLAKIWKKYSGKFLDVFKNTGKDKKKVSVEMEISNSKPEGQFLKLVDFAYTAICVLGDTITEASPGANMQMLSFAKENEEYQKAFDAEFSIGRYSNLDFTIPSSVKKNAKMGIDMDETSGGGTSVSRSIAKHLVRDDVTSPDRVRQISKQFSLAMKRKDQRETVWKMIGGDAGKKWSKRLLDEMGAEDEKRLAYFSFDDNNKEEGIGKMEKEVKEETPIEETPPAPVLQNFEAPPDGEKQKEGEQAPEEPKKEETPEDEYSLAGFIDLVGARAFLEEEGESDTDDFKYCMKMGIEQLPKGKDADFGLLLKAMYSKMCKMSEDMKAEKAKSEVFMAENEELKKFKSETETAQKNFAVEETLKQLSDKVDIDADTIEEMRSEAAKFSLPDLEGWKNYCKAKSFDFAVKKNKKVEQSIPRIGLPFTETAHVKNDIWASN